RGFLDHQQGPGRIQYQAGVSSCEEAGMQFRTRSAIIMGRRLSADGHVWGSPRRVVALRTGPARHWALDLHALGGDEGDELPAGQQADVDLAARAGAGTGRADL